MRLIFAGTPVFAERALAALHAAGHTIALVLTRPDQPARRGQKLTASPVKVWAQAHGLPVAQPPSLRDPQAQAMVSQVGAELMVVAAYGLILPQTVLDLPRLGCLNIHASLLPRWRGAAPIQRAIEAGDQETGITIMQMDAGLDTGPMRLMRRLPIGPQATGGEIHDALAELGGEAIVQALHELQSGVLPMEPQPTEGITYARKLTREDGRLDFTLPACTLVDRIRAFDPVPGCTASLAGTPGQAGPIKVWRARVHQQALPDSGQPTRGSAAAEGSSGQEGSGHPEGPVPGTVLQASARGITVACGPDGRESIDLLELQRPGGRRLPAREWLAGSSLAAGDRLESGGTDPT
ncbi:MAG: methionyl-tRNA formyltransferase [Burkholderiaceae bacterium]